MTEPDNIVLVYLRRLDEKIDRLSDDMMDLKRRATSVEEGLAGLSRRMDRFDMRIERIERRLDIVPAESL